MIVSIRRCGLAGAAVADDQLPLAPPDGDHGIDRLDTCLKRLFHGLPDDNARRPLLDVSIFGRVDRSLAVDGIAECVDDPADQAFADGHLGDPVRSS